MVTDLVTSLRAIKATHALRQGVPPYSTAWDAEIPTVMGGQTQQSLGLLIRLELEMLSQRNPCNGKIQTRMDLETYHLVPFVTIALMRRELHSAMFKDVLTTTAMVGQTNTVNLPQLLPSWAKIRRHLG
jgi:hypothetical protein